MRTKKLGPDEIAFKEGSSITIAGATKTFIEKGPLGTTTHTLVIKIPCTPTKEGSNGDSADNNESIFRTAKDLAFGLGELKLNVKHGELFLDTSVKINGDKGPHAS